MRAVIALGLGVMILIFGGIIWFSRLLALGSAVAILAVAYILYSSYLAAPDCAGDDATTAAAKELLPQFSNQGLSVRNIQTISGTFFSSRAECAMEVSPMAGYDVQTGPKWTRVTYSTSRTKGGNVSVDIHTVGSMVADSAGKRSD